MTLKMSVKGFAVLAFGLLGGQVSAGEMPVPKMPKDKASYGIGVDVARNFQRLGIDIDGLQFVIFALPFC